MDMANRTETQTTFCFRTVDTYNEGGYIYCGLFFTQEEAIAGLATAPQGDWEIVRRTSTVTVATVDEVIAA